MLRGAAFRGGARKEHIKQFIAEIQVLKRLKHCYVVEFIGSYTDTKYLSLIMLPVAEIDLGTYLTRCTLSTHTKLQIFFGCLAGHLNFCTNKMYGTKTLNLATFLSTIAMF